MKGIIKRNYLTIIFCTYIVYCEIIYKVFTNTVSLENLIYPILFGIITGLFLGGFCSFVKKFGGKILSVIFMLIISLPFIVQIVYTNWFKTAVTVQSAFAGAGKALGTFGDMAVTATMAKIVPVTLFVLPVILFIIFVSKIKINKIHFKKFLGNFVTVAALFTLTVLSMFLWGKDSYKPLDLYMNVSSLDTAIAKLGVTTATRIDIRRTVFGLDVKLMDEEHKEISYDNANVSQIDFNYLIENEEDDSLIQLHNYFAKKEPTAKNEYTGMFKDYNLIVLTCEGFSPMAINEELTPTLYKLANNGFVFNDFYTPIWGVSTSDGEYVANIGQYPKTGAWSFSDSYDNYMMYAMGNVFKGLDYSTYAYHNHDYTYYNRNLTHPNLGYNFKGVGNGLEISDFWPESDLEMAQKTVDDYINDEKFHVYYMTVSGHLEYNFIDNDMSIKNKDVVEKLDMSEACKAYIACNIELDKAVEHLINELEKAGKLDKTVFVLSADHYPYGLNNESIGEFLGHYPEENFELYKSSFIIWNSAMKNRVEINKSASSIDILPTLLNLFGVEYDSRLLAGTDILSDSVPIVAFSNGSFITDKCKYNSQTGEIINLTDEEISKEYVTKISNIIVNKFRASALVLDYDYFRIIKGAIR